MPSLGMRLMRLLGTFLIIIALATGGAVVWIKTEFSRPGPLSQDKIIAIPRGATSGSIVEILGTEGVVRSPAILSLRLRMQQIDRSLKAGEYRFAAGSSIADVIEILTKGPSVLRPLVLPEGLTVVEILDIIQRTEFLNGIISQEPDEGSLLPETYFMALNDNRDDLVRRMEKAMNALMDQLWESRVSNLPFSTKKEALTLASIVEKETGVESERRRIAGVYISRLRRNMRLQADPTVAYGLAKGTAKLGKPLGRQLTLNDLRLPTAYNTYTIDGLPPGPITNPGRASIEAVLNPLETGDIYFVADGSGGHVFAKTLEEHNRNVARWRQLSRQPQKPIPPGGPPVSGSGGTLGQKAPTPP